MKNIANKANKIAAALITVEGMCASIVVDEALKAVNCNKVVKFIGRTMVSTMITGYTVAAATKAWMEGAEEDDGKHSVTIDYPHGEKLKLRYAPGETVTISADGDLWPGEDFMYWYADTQNVEFEEPGSAITSFIMPDEKVKITFAYGFEPKNVKEYPDDQDEDEKKNTEGDDDMSITNNPVFQM